MFLPIRTASSLNAKKGRRKMKPGLKFNKKKSQK